MVAKPILDQSVRVQQHLAELINRTKELGKQAHALESLILPQLALLGYQLEKEKNRPQKLISFYDRAKNDEFVSCLNRKLLRLLSDIRLFEETFKHYKSTVKSVSSEVANV